MSVTHEQMVESLPPAWREMYEERAAIRYWEGQQDMETAKREALRETRTAMLKHLRTTGGQPDDSFEFGPVGPVQHDDGQAAGD